LSAIRRPRTGSLLLAALVVLLAAGVVKRAVSVADASQRLRTELALFGHYEHGLRGPFLPARAQSRAGGSDLVCALHRAPGPVRPGAAAKTDFTLCTVIRGSPEHLRVVRAYRVKAR
jgi:hypothetical protein